MAARTSTWRTVGLVVAGIAVVLVVAAVVAAWFIDEPLRAAIERNANEQLDGYELRIGALDLHPLTLGVDLDGVVLRKTQDDGPPFIEVPHWSASLHWSGLLRGDIVSDHEMQRPAIHLKSLPETDPSDAAAGKDQQAWQDAVLSVHSATINELIIRDGVVVYEWRGKPIRLEHIEVRAGNIRNAASKPGEYPADLQASARFLEQAQVEVKGRADLFAKPHLGVDAHVQLSDVSVPRALAVAGLQDVPVRQGEIGLSGHVEYAPTQKAASIEEIRVRNPEVDYVESAARGAGSKASQADGASGAWQDAATSLFPVSVQQLVVQAGRASYRPTPDAQPLTVGDIEATVGNIRNTASKPGEYPSEIHAKARVLNQGHVALDGRADLLAKPMPAVNLEAKVRDLPLQPLRSLTERYNVQFRDGQCDVTGRIEYTGSAAKVVALDGFLLKNAKIDYVHAAETKGQERKRVEKGAQSAKEAHADAEVFVKVEHGKILNSEIGFVNKAASPDYRVFIADLNVEMEDVSNRLSEGTGVVKITGKFMGSGPMVVTGNFRPEKPTPDFDLDVRIVKTRLKSLNNLLRAYGEVDVHAGTFAFFSEMKVKNGKIEGYVKPFFRDVDVYDPEKDENKALMKQMYEAVVGGITGLLQDRPRDAVATKGDVTGPVENPQANTWQIVGNLVQNAFFKAILPGLESEVG